MGNDISTIFAKPETFQFSFKIYLLPKKKKKKKLGGIRILINDYKEAAALPLLGGELFGSFLNLVNISRAKAMLCGFFESIFLK